MNELSRRDTVIACLSLTHWLYQHFALSFLSGACWCNVGTKVVICCEIKAVVRGYLCVWTSVGTQASIVRWATRYELLDLLQSWIQNTVFKVGPIPVSWLRLRDVFVVIWAFLIMPAWLTHKVQETVYALLTPGLGFDVHASFNEHRWFLLPTHLLKVTTLTDQRFCGVVVPVLMFVGFYYERWNIHSCYRLSCCRNESPH